MFPFIHYYARKTKKEICSEKNSSDENDEIYKLLIEKCSMNLLLLKIKGAIIEYEDQKVME